jgi:uncharacterized repeat protein (TIGR01451 family)
MLRRSMFPLLAVALLAAAAPSAHAQPYDASWWTVDGGGTDSAGGPYALSGTVGQPDAGGPFGGGAYVVHSGFWSAFAAGGGPSADLAITKTDGLAAAVPGQAVSYTIVVSNGGPSAVTGAVVTDAPPAALTGPTWTCAASAGSACPPAGSGAIAASADLLVGGSATFVLTATIAPDATAVLVNTASVAVPAGVVDPAPANNTASDSDVLTPRADLAIDATDAPDPVAQGGALTYTLSVTNLGPSTSPGMTVTDALPAEVAFASASGCAHAGGTVTCVLGSLAPSASASVAIQVMVGPAATGSITNTGEVTGAAVDPVAGNDSDTDATLVIDRADGELLHGTRLSADLRALPGPLADDDRYRLRQAPFTSYEVVVDEASGDIGAGSGPLVERVTADGSTVLQASVAAGVGFARSLRWENSTSATVDGQIVRVRSASCATDCDASDTYRIRAYQTTATVPRFNNTGSQVTVLLIQNPGVSTVAGHAHFWGPTGIRLASSAFSLGPRQVAVLNTAGVPGLAGQGGTMTLSHDGRYGELVGKAVALEPATGFSFDSPLETKAR